MAEGDPMSDSSRERAHRILDTGKFAKLQSLKCFPEVYRLLCNGYPFAQVAGLIQNKHCEYEEVQQRSVVKLLKDFYNHIPDNEKVRFEDVKGSRSAGPRPGALDVLAELEGLYEKQKARIQMRIDSEATEKILMDSTAKEIKTGGDLLMKVYRVQKERDEENRGHQELRRGAQMAVRAEEETGQSADFLQDPAKRHQLLEFFDVADEEMVLGLVDEDAQAQVDEAVQAQVPA